MEIWGLTGGIASGKSTVRQMFAELGAPQVDADGLYHALLRPTPAQQPAPLTEAIAAAFGKELILPNGQLDRPALGQRIFADPAARRRLEALTHPAIRQAAQDAFAALAAAGHRQAIYDVPLLFETGLDRRLAGSIVVWVDRAVQLQRLMARDHCDVATALQRIAAQLSLDEKKGRATYVIDNSGSSEATASQVSELWNALRDAPPPGAA